MSRRSLKEWLASPFRHEPIILRPALFGTVDGLGLAIGVLVVLHNRAAVVLAAAAAANGGSELAGMFSGQFLSARGEQARVQRSLANGIGAGAGAIIPVLAFVGLGVTGAVVLLVGMVLAIAVCIPSQPWWRGFAETIVTVGFVTGVCALVALMVG